MARATSPFPKHASGRPLFLLSAVAVVVVTAACSRVPAKLDESRAVSYAAKPATVRIVTQATATFHLARDAASGRPPYSAEVVSSWTGTGVIVNPHGYVITSADVLFPIKDRVTIEKALLRAGTQALRESERSIVEREDLLDDVVRNATLSDFKLGAAVELSNGERYRFDEVARGDGVVVVRIPCRNLPSMQLADSDEVRERGSVRIIAYPAVEDGGESSGADVSAAAIDAEVKRITRHSESVMLFDTGVPPFPGASGAPVVDPNGLLIGIVAADRGDRLRIIASNRMRPIMRSTLVPANVEGSFDREYRIALQSATAGDWLIARQSLQRSAKIYASSPEIALFQRDVDRALQSLPFFLRYRAATVIASFCLAMVAIAVIIATTASRRKRAELALDAQLAARTEPGTEPQPRTFAVIGELTILNGDDAGMKLAIGGSGIRLGRESSACEIVLDNPRVSRIHAEFVLLGGRVLLVDRQSSNGTYVNHRKVQRAFLNDGDVIHFGGRHSVAAEFHM